MATFIWKLFGGKDNRKLEELKASKTQILSALDTLQKRVMGVLDIGTKEYITFAKQINILKSDVLFADDYAIKINVYECLKKAIADCQNYCNRDSKAVLEIVLSDIGDYINDSFSKEAYYADPKFMEAKRLYNTCYVTYRNNAAKIRNKKNKYNTFVDEYNDPKTSKARQVELNTELTDLQNEIQQLVKVNELVKAEQDKHRRVLAIYTTAAFYKDIDSMGGDQDYEDAAIVAATENTARNARNDKFNANLDKAEKPINSSGVKVDGDLARGKDLQEEVLPKKFTHMD